MIKSVLFKRTYLENNMASSLIKRISNLLYARLRIRFVVGNMLPKKRKRLQVKTEYNVGEQEVILKTHHNKMKTNYNYGKLILYSFCQRAKHVHCSMSMIKVPNKLKFIMCVVFDSFFFLNIFSILSISFYVYMRICGIKFSIFHSI